MNSTDQPKKIMLSGIQPTGVFTLGNYIGAIRNWKAMQEQFQCLYFIANLHSLTVRNQPEQLKKLTMDSIALLLACGIDPQKSVLFIQSQVAAHAELSWVLQCHTQFGELSRMTQFKDKSQKHPQNINAGLFSYPDLMAADILLYQADYVPIGADQKQHLEITRDIAVRFNQLYGSTFAIPEPYIPKQGARIMSLADPSKKMSKSDTNPNGFISILDPPDTIIKKFKRAVTDSEAEVKFREDKAGICNLMSIYSVLTEKSLEQIEVEFDGKGYGDFKMAVGETVVQCLRPIQEAFAKFQNDKVYLEQVYQAGAQQASEIANRTLTCVYDKLGILPH